VHVHEADPDELVGLLSLDDADALLTGSGIRTPEVRIARNGDVLGDSTYVRKGATIAGQSLSGLVDPRRALQLFAEGATVVFQGLHRYHEPLTDLVARLELELGHPCQANAYLTPPGSQGFAVHSDTHDVFVFQTHGTKLWEVHHARGESPCDEPSHRSAEEACRVDDVVLRPGLSMYLPTGTPHAARAQDDASLHVTIGINQLTWRGLVRRTVDRLLDAVDDQHLPAGWVAERGDLAPGLVDRLQALAIALASVDPDDAVGHEAQRFLTSRNSRLRGGLHDVLELERIASDTVLRRRPGRPCEITKVGDRVRLLMGDRHLDVPSRVAPAIEVVRQRTTLTPADLGLDDKSNLVLARRLVREGLLQVRPDGS
jgi:bifunctional lysine-specific demethylase and histidyl-hydroxylase NO66